MNKIEQMMVAMVAAAISLVSSAVFAASLDLNGAARTVTDVSELAACDGASASPYTASDAMRGPALKDVRLEGWLGENVSTENRTYTHWYCRAYAKYAEAPWKTLPFDQHLFIACIAPRALLVEGFDRPWFDTEGEYRAVRAASPVWKFLGKGAMPDVPFPPDYDTSAVGNHLGYVRRSQGHGTNAYDWKWMMDFADGVFCRKGN